MSGSDPAQKYEALPEPYKVAALMHEHGIWVHPMNAEPPRPVDEEDPYPE